MPSNPKEDSEHARENTSLNKDANATEDANINEMMKISEEMAEYTITGMKPRSLLSQSKVYHGKRKCYQNN